MMLETTLLKNLQNTKTNNITIIYIYLILIWRQWMGS